MDSWPSDGRPIDAFDGFKTAELYYIPYQVHSLRVIHHTLQVEME